MLKKKIYLMLLKTPVRPSEVVVFHLCHVISDQLSSPLVSSHDLFVHGKLPSEEQSYPRRDAGKKVAKTRQNCTYTV